MYRAVFGPWEVETSEGRFYLELLSCPDDRFWDAYKWIADSLAFTSRGSSFVKTVETLAPTDEMARVRRAKWLPSTEGEERRGRPLKNLATNLAT